MERRKICVTLELVVENRTNSRIWFNDMVPKISNIIIIMVYCVLQPMVRLIRE